MTNNFLRQICRYETIPARESSTKTHRSRARPVRKRRKKYHVQALASTILTLITTVVNSITSKTFILPEMIDETTLAEGY